MCVVSWEFYFMDLSLVFFTRGRLFRYELGDGQAVFFPLNQGFEEVLKFNY